MNYIELTLDAQDAEQAEILMAELADYPFESFEQEGARLKAYIPAERLAGCKGEVDTVLERYGITRAAYLSIEPQNWNAVWEKNFTPVEVDGRLTIRAPFHAPAAAPRNGSGPARRCPPCAGERRPKPASDLCRNTPSARRSCATAPKRTTPRPWA